MTDSTSTTMGRILIARAEDDTTALKFEDQEWTWRELIAEASARSDLLTELRPASERPWNVGVLMDNTPDYVFLIAGAMLCGATIVGLNHTRRGPALAHDVAHTDCVAVLTDDTTSTLLQGAQIACPTLQMSPDVYTPAAYPVLTAEADDPNTRLLLLFTSGSTGTPKAVICSTGRWARMCMLNPIAFNAEDVAYNAMPLFHGNALMSAWGPCLRSGAALALRRRFSASGFLPDIQRYGATFFNYVGRSLSYILAQPENPFESDNRLRFGFGTEASVRDRAEFERRYRTPLFESYGSSEGACYIVRTPDSPPECLGRPQVGHRAAIVKPDGTVCATARFGPDGTLSNAEDAVGEIVSRGGAALFEGYYRDPEASADRVRADDYWTGDLGYRDAEGNFYFAGRTGDWMRVDSENFTASPIERIMLRHNDIVAAAVYGVPDIRTGDQVMAAIEVREPDAFDPSDFAVFLTTQPDMSPKWTPRYIRVCPKLPTTATMKIDKPALRSQRWQCNDRVFERTADLHFMMTTERVADLLSAINHHRRHIYTTPPADVQHGSEGLPPPSPPPP